MAWALPAPGGGEEAEGRGGGKVGNPGAAGARGCPSCCRSLRLPCGLGARGAGAGARPGVRDRGAHRSGRGGFTSLRVLPAGLAILGLPASHIWPCTSRRRRARALPDPSNRGGSGESREIPARRTWGVAAAVSYRRQLPPPSTGPYLGLGSSAASTPAGGEGKPGDPTCVLYSVPRAPHVTRPGPRECIPRSSSPGLHPPVPTPALQPARPGWPQPRPRCS